MPKIKVKAYKRNGRKVKKHKRKMKKIKKKVFFDEFLGPDKENGESIKLPTFEESKGVALEKIRRQEEKRERELNDIRQADREVVERHLRERGW